MNSDKYYNLFHYTSQMQGYFIKEHLLFQRRYLFWYKRRLYGER